MSVFKYIAQIATFMGKNTETAPVDDTTPSGLNGRLQRIAQHLSSTLTGLDAINAKLDTSTDLTPTNAKLDAANVILTSVDTNSTATNTKLDTLITAQTATNTKLDTVITALNTANGLLLDIKNKP